MSCLRERRRPGLLLAVTLLCISVTGCGRDGPTDPAAGPRRLAVGKCSLIGNHREFNDDAVDVKDLSGSVLCLLADGMGGEVNGKVLGQVAARRAFEVLTDELGKQAHEATTPDETATLIRRTVVTANNEVIDASAKDPDLRNMGTTLVVAWWRQEDGMYIAGVGDSRAYVIRGEAIEQLTVDDSMAQALVQAKTITAEEARTHRFRNVLWKYLGSKEVGDGPAVKFVRLRNQDRILLCTDGLHGVVPDDQILKCIRRHPDVQQCADALCQLALDSGSRDNVSCIVIEMAESR